MRAAVRLASYVRSVVRPMAMAMAVCMVLQGC
jgi:hypothetical protein